MRGSTVPRYQSGHCEKQSFLVDQGFSCLWFSVAFASLTERFKKAVLLIAGIDEADERERELGFVHLDLLL